VYGHLVFCNEISSSTCIVTPNFERSFQEWLRTVHVLIIWPRIREKRYRVSTSDVMIAVSIHQELSVLHYHWVGSRIRIHDCKVVIWYFSFYVFRGEKNKKLYDGGQWRFASWNALCYWRGQISMRFILSATKQFTKALVLYSVVMVGVLTKKSDIVEVVVVSSEALCRFGKVLGWIFFGMSMLNRLWLVGSTDLVGDTSVVGDFCAKRYRGHANCLM